MLHTHKRLINQAILTTIFAAECNNQEKKRIISHQLSQIPYYHPYTSSLNMTLFILNSIGSHDNFITTPYNRFGWTLLHAIAQEPYPYFFRILYKNTTGLNIEVQDNIGNTPLHHAARSGQWYMVKYLCAIGANVHAQNNQGLTPDQLSAKYDHELVTHYLQAQKKDASHEQEEK